MMKSVLNYRLPNVNAALGLAQMESLPKILNGKRLIAKQYQQWGKENGTTFIKELEHTKSNYWLNTVITKSKAERDLLLEETNNGGIMTRPIWIPMHNLLMYSNCQKTELKNTEWLQERVVNVPSSVRSFDM